MQIRNSDSKNSIDCIISPIIGKDGKKFDSREQLQLSENNEYEIEQTQKAKLPLSGDAN